MTANWLGNSFAAARLQSAGMSLRLVRSPLAPKMTITQGSAMRMGSSTGGSVAEVEFMVNLPLAVVLTHGGFGNYEVALDGVERRPHPDGQRGVEGDMAKGKAGDDGDFERQQSFPEHVFNCLAIFLGLFGFRVAAILVDADGDAGDLLEQPGVEEMGQHAVEAIRDFVEVFEEEDLILE